MPKAVATSVQKLSSSAYQPTGKDILCGRGRGNFLHEGNKLYISILRKNLKEYLGARKREEKSVIIKAVVSSLTERGFRFLKQDGTRGGWCELTSAMAYCRTAHAIRDLVRKHKHHKGNKGSKPASKAPSRTISTKGIASKKKTEQDSSMQYQHDEGLLMGIDQSFPLFRHETLTDFPDLHPSNGFVTGTLTLDQPVKNDTSDMLEEVFFANAI